MPTDFNEHNPILSERRPSVHTDEHGFNKPEPHDSPKFDPEHPGYELTDVNTKGVVVFLAALCGFLIVFFALCYAMGKAINFGLLKQDTENAASSPYGGATPEAVQRRGRSLVNNPEQEQAEAARIAQSFPAPRPPVDDDDQETADMHAREDLLLEHYTYASAAGAAGTIRIPVEKAMELVVKRGLPVAATPATAVQGRMVGDTQANVTAPLTNGFSRTGYEQNQIDSREQQRALAHEANESK